MNHELAKTLTTALVQFIDRERPEGTMDCSNSECVSLEKAFEGGTYDVVEKFIKKKLSRLTEFEQEVSDIVEYCKEHGENVAFDYAKRHAKTLLALAKKELPMPEDTVIFQKGVEEGKRLEREEVTKRSIQGYGDGKQDALRMVKDFIESHFNTNKAREGEDLTDLYRKEYAQPLCLRNGGVCTNPMRDCINCIPTLERFNTQSGTSTLKAEG